MSLGSKASHQSDLDQTDEQCVANAVKQNQNLLKVLTQFEKNTRKTPKNRITLGWIELRRQRANEYWAEFETLHKVIINKDYEDHLDYFTNEVYEKAEETVLSCLSFIRDEEMLFYSSRAQPSTSTDPQNDNLPTTVSANHRQPAIPPLTTSSSNIKLPRITIDKFNGDISEWPTFYDLFTTLIHNQNSITAVEKLHYLKTSLSGPAKEVISRFQLTGINYTPAWEALIARYENKRELVNAKLRLLLNQPSVQVDTPANLRKLLDNTIQSIYALQNMEISTSQWDPILVYVISQKLPKESYKCWEESLGTSVDIPLYDDLIEFIEGRCKTLEALQLHSQHSRQNSNFNVNQGQKKKSQSFHTSTKSSSILCALCSDPHVVRNCDKFKNMSIDEKTKTVKEKFLCTNCLSAGHLNSKCRSNKRCLTCRRRHHTLLHNPIEHSSSSTNNNTLSTSNATPTTENQVLNTFHSCSGNDPDRVLLATALVRVRSNSGIEMVVRALIDQGSQVSFLSEHIFQQLHSEKIPVEAVISGIGTKNVTTHIQTEINIAAVCHDNFSAPLKVMVLKKITGPLPSTSLSAGPWEHIRNLTLADPNFNFPGKIDMLLGADIFAEILMDGIQRGPSGSPIAQKTKLGWVLSGGIHEKKSFHRPIKVCSFVNCLSLNDELKRFWELEDLNPTRKQTKEEEQCEQIYENTYKRDEDGRFVVRIPFVQEFGSTVILGQSKSKALSRYHQQEVRFRNKPEVEVEYNKCLQEYVQLQHMQVVTTPLVSSPNGAFHGSYLPHHAVMKETSTSTKLRVVFDASCSTTSGKSLNECVYVGPRLQDDLLNLILRWRKHKIAMTADIEKMYRQIKVADEDIDFQRVVWRPAPKATIQDYQLKTVTFGTACAPYLAIKTLKTLARTAPKNYEIATATINSDFYVDDMLSGADSIDDAIIKQNQVTRLLSSAGFTLKKWTSNCEALLQNVPEAHRETTLPLSFDTDNTIKTLGLQWHPAADFFQFRICIPPISKNITKRKILSDVAKVFDPNGWLAPVTIKAKIMMQTLWLNNLGWDEVMPTEFIQTWVDYRDQLADIEEVQIPRWLGSTGASQTLELHCFCDASVYAYAAVVYLRIIEIPNKTISTVLLASKTKVAPLKKISLARLELCAAVLGAKLIHRVKESMQFPAVDMFGWTDSTIVLCWLQGQPHKWEVFVANRVVEIQNILPSHCWRHVKTTHNSADCATRGITPMQLKNHSLWWQGPQWLQDDTTKWPIQPVLSAQKLSHQPTSLLVTQNSDPWEFINKCSTYNKLVRSTAFLFRFLNNVKPASTKRTEWLTTNELKEAATFWIKQAQLSNFKTDICNLQQRNQTVTNSKLQKLNPFVDGHGILRVGGRLQHAELCFDSTHPIILPSTHRFTHLLISKYHIQSLHGGPQLLINMLRQRYWVIDARNLVKNIVHKCIQCHRQKGVTSSQLMGQLPRPRVTQSRPFLHTGVDYAGPVDIKTVAGRSGRLYKGYIAVFVCMSIKAIHLEIVTDLSSAGFIAAFHRFTSRRGLCTALYSDCGTNFVGAARQLNHWQLQHQAAEKLATESVDWHFIPPGSPHFGGLWEAGVKATKHHLIRSIGNSTLTYEELNTMLTQIEAVLNSRPLCQMTSDPSDLTALTPAHFLIGSTLITTPEPNLLDTNVNRLNRWQQIQYKVQYFWKRWHKEYLSNLQQRAKWLTPTPNVEINNLVLIKDDRLPPRKWLLGRITAVHPGKDGLVRVVSLRTQNGTVDRPITKVAVLPIEH